MAGQPPAVAPYGEGQPQQQDGNGIAVAGMVLGILSLVLYWVPFLGLILGLLGLIFGIKGMKRAKIVGKGNGLGITGLVTGILGTIVGVIMILVVFIFVATAVDAAEEAERNSLNWTTQPTTDME